VSAQRCQQWCTQGVYGGITVVYPGYVRWGIPQGGVYTRVYRVGYTSGWCIYRVYTGLYASLLPYYAGYMPPYYTLVYTPPVPPWVYPVLPHTQWCTVYRTRCSQRLAAEPWAQRGRNLCAESLPAPMVPNSVTVVVPVCAELLRLSQDKVRIDRIDEGSSPLYSP